MKTLKYILIFLISLSFTAPLSAQRRKAAAPKPQPDPRKVLAEKYSEQPIIKAMFSDSTVVYSSEWHKAIPLPSYAGHFIDDEGVLKYENELGDLRLFTKTNAEGHQRIYRQTMLGNTWSEAEELVIDTELTDLSCPYLRADGQTLYFSGRDADDEENSSYNLYTSSLNTEDGTFMKPQQLPRPYLSEADDIAFIENETDNVAWLVTKRNQEEGKLCIYTIKMTDPWEYYDTDELTTEQIISLAELQSIADTWPSQEARNAEIQRLAALAQDNIVVVKSSNLFVINSNTVITDASQLRSGKSRQLYAQYQELINDIADKEHQLDVLRQLYHKTAVERRAPMHDSILNLENEIQQQHTKALSLAKDIRLLEN